MTSINIPNSTLAGNEYISYWILYQYVKMGWNCQERFIFNVQGQLMFKAFNYTCLIAFNLIKTPITRLTESNSNNGISKFTKSLDSYWSLWLLTGWSGLWA